MNGRDSQMVPRNGLKLNVIFVCRVSDPGPGKQDVRSLDDQEVLYRHWMITHMPGVPYEVTVIAGSGSGEYLERKEYTQLLELVETQDFDLILTEDLGRIIRRIHAHLFCELCVDCGTRLVAINDHCDTAEAGWQDRSIFSAWHHERSNRDTSDRIKRSHVGHFDTGRCPPLEIYGISIPRGKDKSDADWCKDPDAEPIYKKWFAMLDAGSSFSEVADWLNDNGVPTGPHCRKDTWDCRMVGRVTRNPILKGIRYRNRMKTRRRANGKYVSEKASPEELRTRAVPHLAFFEADYYDRIIAKLHLRNEGYRRNGQDGRDVRAGVPKSRTRFPGQSLYCGICGRLFVFGGHGQTDHLMCDGARDYRCWLGRSIDGPLAAEKIANAVYDVIEVLPEFDAAFLQLLNEEAELVDAARLERIKTKERHHRQLQRQTENLVKFIREGNSSQRIREELIQVESELTNAAIDLQSERMTPTDAVTIPSIDEVKSLARAEVHGLDVQSWEFNKVMQRLTPRIVVVPYRLCDGGDIVFRARFRLSLGRLLTDARQQDVLERPLEQALCVDLFNAVQREEFRPRVIEMRKTMTEREVSHQLGITHTAAQRASALQRRMDELGLTDPYVPVNEPPEDLTKMRRHKHKRFRFEPLPDAGVS